jgi:hypothetical protein
VPGCVGTIGCVGITGCVGTLGCVGNGVVSKLGVEPAGIIVGGVDEDEAPITLSSALIQVSNACVAGKSI